MKQFPRRLTLLVAAVLAAGAVHADGPFRNPDNKSANDAGEGTYPVPYKKPTEAEIVGVMLSI